MDVNTIRVAEFVFQWRVVVKMLKNLQVLFKAEYTVIISSDRVIYKNENDKY